VCQNGSGEERRGEGNGITRITSPFSPPLFYRLGRGNKIQRTGWREDEMRRNQVCSLGENKLSC